MNCFALTIVHFYTLARFSSVFFLADGSTQWNGVYSLVNMVQESLPYHRESLCVFSLGQQETRNWQGSVLSRIRFCVALPCQALPCLSIPTPSMTYFLLQHSVLLASFPLTQLPLFYQPSLLPCLLSLFLSCLCMLTQTYLSLSCTILVPLYFCHSLYL